MLTWLTSFHQTRFVFQMKIISTLEEVSAKLKRIGSSLRHMYDCKTITEMCLCVRCRLTFAMPICKFISDISYHLSSLSTGCFKLKFHWAIIKCIQDHNKYKIKAKFYIIDELSDNQFLKDVSVCKLCM